MSWSFIWLIHYSTNRLALCPVSSLWYIIQNPFCRNSKAFTLHHQWLSLMSSASLWCKIQNHFAEIPKLSHCTTNHLALCAVSSLWCNLQKHFAEIPVLSTRRCHNLWTHLPDSSPVFFLYSSWYILAEKQQIHF